MSEPQCLAVALPLVRLEMLNAQSWDDTAFFERKIRGMEEITSFFPS